jgi:hypothetical protein
MVYKVNVCNFFDMRVNIKYFMNINYVGSILHGIFIAYFNNIAF